MVILDGEQGDDDVNQSEAGVLDDLKERSVTIFGQDIINSTIPKEVDVVNLIILVENGLFRGGHSRLENWADPGYEISFLLFQENNGAIDVVVDAESDLLADAKRQVLDELRHVPQVFCMVVFNVLFNL